MGRSELEWVLGGGKRGRATVLPFKKFLDSGSLRVLFCFRIVLQKNLCELGVNNPLCLWKLYQLEIMYVYLIVIREE